MLVNIVHICLSFEFHNLKYYSNPVFLKTLNIIIFKLNLFRKVVKRFLLF